MEMSVKAYLFEVILVTVGAVLVIAGQLLPRQWQKRVAALIGTLLVIGALASAFLELSTTLIWGTPDLAEEPPTSEPGLWSAGLTETPGPSPSPWASLTPGGENLEPSDTPGPASFPATSTASATSRATDTPRPAETPVPTETPRPATITPTATDTSRPTPIDVTPVTATATETPEPEPTREPRPTSTPESQQRRLGVTKLASNLQGVVIIDQGADVPTTIFELGGRIRYNPIYSAAWSPDGRRVVIAYSWNTSDYDQGIRLRVVNADGTGAKDILSLTTAGQYRGLGNALWSPDGTKILFALIDGPDNGVWEINPDGSGLRRLANSVPGEWPRYWTTDGEWLVTVSGDNSLAALERAGERRTPFATLGSTEVYDPRYHPWRARREPRCEQQEDSWWKCR